ncbi:phosphatidylinositol-glycan biosynthesis class F protein [Impatiens glandulifera]|uniref:phosphatidylinositol-glycan biosynthesis class F protein n=1 Tax=Impatiens glandulifera TaxID=253017 RepID=UPI001FB06355|nr:phosphatidylinositol-glycan biosynthesis class F protein [Impatiens glandulifera]
MKLRRQLTSNYSASPWKVLITHLICGLGLSSAFWITHNLYNINLISEPTQTLQMIWVIGSPLVIIVYSNFRMNPEHNSYWKALAQGILGLIAGAVVNALGAIALGAPVGTKYIMRTLHWSLMMSTFTFTPAACVFGSSWSDWLRIFAHTKSSGSVDYMLCLPAHGAIIGAWFGAWPMPLDWERTWQEWPICVTYGAMAGYFVGMLASFIVTTIVGGEQHVKGE